MSFEKSCGKSFGAGWNAQTGLLTLDGTTTCTSACLTVAPKPNIWPKGWACTQRSLLHRTKKNLDYCGTIFSWLAVRMRQQQALRTCRGLLFHNPETVQFPRTVSIRQHAHQPTGPHRLVWRIPKAHLTLLTARHGLCHKQRRRSSIQLRGIQGSASLDRTQPRFSALGSCTWPDPCNCGRRWRSR